ncbi:hypothetical protein EJ03DRAFT_347049 [Teratosphaeria nubilosa]|uniref:SGF29 C-terminal domain-containing protein n=1 Tax=Teratosphaeria nubilosa TaxID=161662 RepID=A0A6G1LNP4_9PEZI|nr:hypothetical protein EJ03DRAFT_347049 [Teratosphaeria nubilosa]
MSSRNRGRGNNNQDADEERRLWREIQAKGAEIDSLVARSQEIGLEIIDVEKQQGALVDAGKATSAALDDRLEKLYRENVKICEQVEHLTSGSSNDMNILDSINILAALRENSEEHAVSQPSQSQRVASGNLKRKPGKASGKPVPAAAPAALSTEDHDDTSAAPSPRISISSAANRLTAKNASSRAGSIPATRETSVKIEDGAESVASSTDIASNATGIESTKPATGVGKLASAASRPSNRLVLKMGEIVFCRHDPKNYDPKKGEQPEGEGILCRVTNVIGEGKQRRYEVQDADTSGDPPPPQRASVSQLIQIPESNRGLPDLAKGRGVLAQYPDTTTFYKAEVCELWKGGKNGGTEELGMVRLMFQDDTESKEVERRFVLSEK